MKSRTLISTLLNKADSRFGRIIVLTGARQTGKTTLAQKVFGNYHYLSIEDPITRTDFVNLTANQWNTLYPQAILDEVQKGPQLIESIKAVYDQYLETKYILLGSSQILLLDKVKESLAGRCLIYEVLPLTLPELVTSQWEDSVKPSFLQQFIETGKLPVLPSSFALYNDHGNALQVFDYYLTHGGYPAITDISITNDERREWLYNYIRTYLERDIRDLVNLRDLEPFVRIQRTSALLTGQTVNYSQLAREAGITAGTAQRFIRYLELSHQAIMLEPWFRNSLKRLSKSPKLHYLDPGIQRAILRKQGAVSGNEFESAVIAEIYKQLRNMQFRGNLFHLRTVDGREVDLLIELEHGYIAIEIKMSGRVSKGDARHLFQLEEILDKPLLQSFVLSQDLSIQHFDSQTLALPAAMCLT